MTKGFSAAGLAGWLFADLLLVIAIVFIGSTVDRTGNLVASATSTTSTTTTTTTLPVVEEPDDISEDAICPGIDPPRDDLVQVVDMFGDQDRLVGDVSEFLNTRIAGRLAERNLTGRVDPSQVSVGFLYVYAGTAGNTPSDEREARRNATVFVERLIEAIPDRFGNSDHIPSYSRSLGPGQARVLYFPRVPQLGANC